MTVEPALLMMLVAVAATGLALALIALRRSDGGGFRVVVLALLAALGISAYVGGERVLGNARPVALEVVRAAEEAQVLYAQAVRNKGIFLLLATSSTPVYYRLPWDEATATQLRKALEKAERNQAQLMFRFEPSLERREPKFYAMPQPALPEKDPPKPGIEYRSREWNI